MNREKLLEQVKTQREQGNSIRAIASGLVVHRSRVERALKALGLRIADEAIPPFRNVHSLAGVASGVFVGRHRELEELKAPLEAALLGRGGWSCW